MGEAEHIERMQKDIIKDQLDRVMTDMSTASFATLLTREIYTVEESKEVRREYLSAIAEQRAADYSNIRC